MSVMLYPCMLCVALLMRVCELFGETIRNVFSCYFVVECYGCVVVLCWIDHV